MDPVPAPAGFWRRYAAYSLDFAVLGALAAVLAWSRLLAGWHATTTAASTLIAMLGQTLADALMTGTSLPLLAQDLLHHRDLLAAADALQSGLLDMLLPWLLCYALLAALWHIGGESSRWQGSPGKRALRLRVTDCAGQPLPLPRAALRHFAGSLSWLTLNLGHALAALPPQKRALHDYIAGTQVICDAADPRLPRWAVAWIALQWIVAVGLPTWWLLHRIAALQSGLA